MERYAKYRESIKHMPEEKFGEPSSSSEDISNAIKSDSAITFGARLTPLSSKNSVPYRINLRKKRLTILAKLLFLAAVIAAFAVWWYFLQGRKPL